MQRFQKDSIIITPGPEKDAIHQAIQELSLTEHVKLCDWLPYERMPRACRLGTALILASTHDQWGMTVNESLSAGSPVLVSNRCGAHELVQNDINGFTFGPTDAQHLTALLLRLHREPDSSPGCVVPPRLPCGAFPSRNT